MSAWTRNERIGCGGMVLGVVATLVALWAIPALERRAERSSATGQEAGAQLLLDEQRKLLAEQTAAARDELRRLHDERIALRQTRIEALTERYTADGDPRYDTIVLHNACSYPIDAALYYLDLDGSWITRGWWEVKAGDSVRTNAFTRNAYVYFYAENLGVGRTWDGAGKPESLTLEVVDPKFDHLAEEPFVYDDPRRVSFYRHKTADNWGDQTETFECFAEAPPLPPEAPEPQATEVEESPPPR
jgi:Protein of unknown function (DUF1036)